MNNLFLGLLICLSTSGQQQYQEAISELQRANLALLRSSYPYDIGGVGGAFMDNISKLDYHLITYQPLTLEEAREAVVKMTLDILDTSNAVVSAKPYFANDPLTPKNIRLALASRVAHGSGDREKIALVHLGQGTIYYDIHPGSYFEDFHKETFEEALVILGVDVGKSTVNEEIQ